VLWDDSDIVFPFLSLPQKKEKKSRNAWNLLLPAGRLANAN